LTGPIGEKGAGRLSFSGTQRDGTLYNVSTNRQENDLNNVGVRGSCCSACRHDGHQVHDRLDAGSARTATRQPFAGVVPTLRPANRQFEQIIADLNYQP